MPDLMLQPMVATKTANNLYPPKPCSRCLKVSSTLGVLGLCIFLLSLVQVTPVTATPLVTRGQGNQAEIKQRKQGLSFIPIAAANSTFGFMLGGAGIYYPQTTAYKRIQSTGILTLKGQAFASLNYDGPEQAVSWGVSLIGSDFFNPLYGESKRRYTRPPDQIDMKLVTRFAPFTRLRLGRDISLKLSYIHESRVEAERFLPEGKEPALKQRIYPDERNSFFGWSLAYNPESENELSPIGTYVAWTSKLMPGPFASSVEATPAFLLTQLDLRYHYAINPSNRRSPVLSQRIYVGTNLGKPTQHSRVLLGGNYILRGFGAARFRAVRFYTSLSEVRFPIWGVFSGATFFEVGDYANDKESFDELLMSYGAGVRIGLPPDYVAKVRIDFGFSRDGFNLSMQANQAF